MKRGIRYTKLCVHCQEEYIGTKVAMYCPKCAAHFKKTKFAICYRKHNTIIPHFREKGD